MTQGCNAGLGRLITIRGRLPVVQPPTSSTRRHTWVVTQEDVCPGCRRCTYALMVARLGLLQAVRGCTRLWRLGALLGCISYQSVAVLAVGVLPNLAIRAL